MASPINPPRGMRDFLPGQKAARERVLSVIRSVYAAHGFDEIETPVMEDSARLHSGLGGDNEKLAFGVQRRDLTLEDLAAAASPLDLVDLGLRFDLTVPLARFYATHRAELPSVFRSVQIAPVWRAERPQKGRYRQFMQCDIDVIGEAGPLAEVELISATAATLTALGLAGWSIRINDRRILAALLDRSGVAPEGRERVLIAIDKLDKVGVAGVLEELETLGVATAHIQGILESADAGWIETAVPPWLDYGAYGDLLALRDALPGIPLRFDPTLVRGMGYYTGTIFEIAHDELGYSLGGGGRYDGMIGRFLGEDVPAAGFSIGFERIVDLVVPADDGAADAVAVLYDDGADPALLAALKAELIAQGRRVRLERTARNAARLYDRLAQQGFVSVATVHDDTATAADLAFRPLQQRD